MQEQMLSSCASGRVTGGAYEELSLRSQNFFFPQTKNEILPTENFQRTLKLADRLLGVLSDVENI